MKLTNGRGTVVGTHRHETHWQEGSLTVARRRSHHYNKKLLQISHRQDHPPSGRQLLQQVFRYVGGQLPSR